MCEGQRETKLLRRRRKNERDAGGLCRFLEINMKAQNRTEREQVSANIQFLTPNLLRGHIGDRAYRAAGTGQVFF
jgi:hypothetical protein